MTSSSKESTQKETLEISKHIRVVKEKIDTYLSEDQPSDVLIIKSHLICEYYINQILLVTEKCNSKEMRDLTFYKKLQKVFNKEELREKPLYRKVKTLNNLRNKTYLEKKRFLAEQLLGIVQT